MLSHLALPFFLVSAAFAADTAPATAPSTAPATQSADTTKKALADSTALFRKMSDAVKEAVDDPSTPAAIAKINALVPAAKLIGDRLAALPKPTSDEQAAYMEDGLAMQKEVTDSLDLLKQKSPAARQSVLDAITNITKAMYRH